MIEKFEQDNKAQILRNWLNKVDYSTADFTSIERDIYTALIKNQHSTIWSPQPVAPYAEPVDLNALVGGLLSGANEELGYQLSRVDSAYNILTQTNNFLKSELEGVEKQVTEASDDVQAISFVVGDENREFYWISDTFNSNAFVANSSDCLVDTDYGAVSLAPLKMEIVPEFEVVLDRAETVGIPGCNMLVLGMQKVTASDSLPNPTVTTEQNQPRNVAALADNDPSTWFEIERNFIPQKQKLARQSRAFIYTESNNQLTDVLEVTKSLDWKARITWSETDVDTGKDGTGVWLAEFKDLDSTTTNSSVNDAVLSLELTLPVPTPLSNIKITPFIRAAQNPINIKYLKVLLDGNWVDVAAQTQLGTNRSTSKLQQDILRRTGYQSTGTLYTIPSDREVSKIRICLTSSPILALNGLAHRFKEKEEESRSERKHGLWRTVDKWRTWTRIAVNEIPPTFTSRSETPKLYGALVSTAKAGAIVGDLFTQIQTQRTLNSLYQNQGKISAATKNVGAGLGGTLSAAGNAAGALSGALSAAKIGGSIGQFGSFLGAAAPYLAAFAALDQLAGGLFNYDHSVTLIGAPVEGYDIFKGWRAGIALRDITMSRTTYRDTGTVLSVKRQFPGSVTTVGLFVEEDIPTSWGPGAWITYYVSEDGVNWSPIQKLTDVTLEKGYTLTTPSDFIYFKAELRGNPADPFHTPQLKHYAIQGLPA